MTLAIFTFFVVLALIRIACRVDRRLQRVPIRIDVYHHWPTGPGERWPAEPLLLQDRVADNIVPLRQRGR